MMVKFKEFPLGGINGLFEIKATKKKFNANTVEFGGDYPYVIRSSLNNGIRGYITEDVKYLNEANTISFGQDTATMFYQKSPYFTGDKIKIFTYKNKKLDRRLAMYLITCMRKSFSSFTWGNSFFDVKVLNKVIISLPVNDSGEIDYEYIEEHVSELEKECINKLETYLQDSGLDSYSFNYEEQRAIEEYRKGNIKYKEFKINDLFTSSSGDFDIQQKHINNKGIYVVSSGQTNNGIIGKSDIKSREFEEKTITVDMFGYSYFRDFKYKMVTHARVFSLKFKSKNLTNEEGLYFTSQFKHFPNIFSYNNMASWDKIKDMSIRLPINSLNEIDFDFINKFIKAQQKLVIKDVVLWKDEIIDAK